MKLADPHNYSHMAKTSKLSVRDITTVKHFHIQSNTVVHTLHTLSPATRMFLAARSLCTKAFLARYSMPEAMSLQNPRRTSGMSEGTNCPGLLNVKVGAAYKSLVEMMIIMNDLWLLTLASA